MRAIVVSMLAGGLLLSACGGGGNNAGDDTSGTGGKVNPARTGGTGGSKPAGTGGALPEASGGSSASGGTSGGSGGVTGSGGASTGSGGAAVSEDAGTAPTAEAGSAAETATPPPAGDGSLGGLGPGSADDSAPLVLPGSKLIFDGKTLTGWKCDAKWSVKDGTIDGTGTGNSFCSTADNHDTFRLTGKSRVVQDPANHAGICFWGPPGKCLQITPVSGSLWDYRGGGEVRTLPRTRDYMKWNFFELLVDAKTGNIDMTVEGHAFPTYVDKKGHPTNPIGLQLHAKPNEVQYKDLALEDNPKEMKLLTAMPGK
jgi:hypothetical protein